MKLIWPYYLFTGTTVAICTGLYWLFATIWNQITPLLLGSPIQSHGYFYVLAGINACAFLSVLIFLPETKVRIVSQVLGVYLRATQRDLAPINLSCSSPPMVSNCWLLSSSMPGTVMPSPPPPPPSLGTSPSWEKRGPGIYCMHMHSFQWIAWTHYTICNFPSIYDVYN